MEPESENAFQMELELENISSPIKHELLDYISECKAAIFTDKITGEPEMNQIKRRDIAHDIINNSFVLFLARFGLHLQEKHLDYLENNVREEEKIIVNVHLNQLRRILRDKKPENCNKSGDHKMDTFLDSSNEEKMSLDLRCNILDHLSVSKIAHFKSQQVGEPELSITEKREIAESLLERSPTLFLSRFGIHLEEEHLIYFEKCVNGDSYEINFYLEEIKRSHSKRKSEVIVKNRRFEALKQMLDEGSYFGETEMRKRNPLLYEQMIGQFLTEEEKNDRQTIDTTNITFVNLLLEQIDRDAEKKLKHQQIEAEDDVMEEEETSSDDDDDEKKKIDTIVEDEDVDKTLWGESYQENEFIADVKPKSCEDNKHSVPDLSEVEKRLLMEEFRSNMFESFLQGKDVDFDYSQVDSNPEYDDLVVQGIDEEEKYFDSESPEVISVMDMSDDDELDSFMKNLKPAPTTDQLTEQMKQLNQSSLH
uniref:CCD97-like C-terminal domain-containing protein n=1 Tax=Clastoptera arizonana TaxID=38151 RepID=A0A1B6ECE4_9HEMI